MNEHIRRGEAFLRACVFDGLAHSLDAVSGRHVKPYPEVTGYIIDYFCRNREIPDEVPEAAKKLLKMQDKETGGWPSFNNPDDLYTFDTAQILTGLCNLYKRIKDEELLRASVRAGEFIRNMQMGNGAFIPVFDRKKKYGVLNRNTYAIWNGPFSGLMCKLTEAYLALNDVMKGGGYEKNASLTADFYSQVQPVEHTHPMGYWLEGLYAAGRKEQVKKILEAQVIPRIRKNGFIPYTESLPYAYVSGTVQLGILLYKLGYDEPAERIREYGRSVQSKHVSGGLFQYADSEGKLDNHVHTEINSWGTKYFCQLERLMEEGKKNKVSDKRYKKYYGNYWPAASEKIYAFLLSNIKKQDRILEVGAGSGHLLFRLLLDGYLAEGCEIRKEEYDRTLQLFEKEGFGDRLFLQDIMTVQKGYQVIYTTGLMQCIKGNERKSLIKKLSELSPKVIIIVPKIVKERNERSDEKVGVAGCTEYVTTSLPYELNGFFRSVKAGKWEGQELNLTDDFCLYICEN